MVQTANRIKHAVPELTDAKVERAIVEFNRTHAASKRILFCACCHMIKKKGGFSDSMRRPNAGRHHRTCLRCCFLGGLYMRDSVMVGRVLMRWCRPCDLLVARNTHLGCGIPVVPSGATQ